VVWLLRSWALLDAKRTIEAWIEFAERKPPPNLERIGNVAQSFGGS
jgi:hypothetical protein